MSVPVIQADAIITASPTVVWAALVRRTSEMFFGAKVDTDWVVGHPIVFSGEWKGQAFEDHGEILAFEEKKALSFTHYSPSTGKPDLPENYNTVTITLAPAGERTRVSVSEQPAGQLTDEQSAEHRNNWAKMLDALKDVVEGRAAKGPQR